MYETVVTYINHNKISEITVCLPLITHPYNNEIETLTLKIPIHTEMQRNFPQFLLLVLGLFQRKKIFFTKLLRMVPEKNGSYFSIPVQWGPVVVHTQVYIVT